MSSLQGFNFDKQKLDYLLMLFEQGQLSQENVLDLKTLLEKMHKTVSEEGNLELAGNISRILIALKGFLSGRINLTEYVSVSGA